MQTQQLNNWWQRNDLGYRDGVLFFGDENLAELARSSGTPTFAYCAPRVVEKLEGLSSALTRHQVRHHIFYALKANRFAPLLTCLRLHGQCGIDVCSPRELLLARQLGFAESSITYTGTSVSNDDLDIIAAHPQVLFNCDAISTIRRLGERCPGRSIGIRINPRQTASHLEGISYAGTKASKFGIYPDRFAEALATAASYDMPVNTLHFHAASGYLDGELEQFEQILAGLTPFLELAPDIHTVDIGGGLGVPLREGEAALDLDRWAAMLARFANRHSVKIHVEPGDYLVKDAGLLLATVNTVEEKGGTTFVGIDAGFNLSNLHAYYHYPFIIAPLQPRLDTPLQTVTIAGNINEGIDLLAEDIALPELREGDVIALMNLGGYSASSSSNHCMRGDYSEYLLGSASLTLNR